MKKLITLVAILGLTGIAWADSAREATVDRMDRAGRVLHEVMAAPDKGIPEEVLEHARCIPALHGRKHMLWTIIVVILLLWILGFSFHVAGGLIHLLLVVALIVFVFQLLAGRRG